MNIKVKYTGIIKALALKNAIQAHTRFTLVFGLMGAL